MRKVLLIDYAWPDTTVETAILEAAGLRLVAGPARAGSATEVEALVREHQPAAIMTNWAPVSRAAIDASKDLKIVARLGVGLDNIAVDAATERGIWVSNVPDYCVEEVSDHAIAMLLAWTRGLLSFDRSVKAGAWNPADAKLRRVAALTVGILGYGRIGRRTSEKFAAFRSRVLIFNRTVPADVPENIKLVPLDELLDASDVVIVNLPLTAETTHLIDYQRLTRMRKGAFLINVSRGAVVDSEALERALDDGILSGAALDVVEGEPNPPRSLVVRANVIVTPHVAFSSDVSIAELRRRAAEDVVAVMHGQHPRGGCNNPKIPTPR